MAVRIKRAVERIEVPAVYYQLAHRRMKHFVALAAGTAACGTLDLENLATSAYLQGVWDSYEAMERRGMLMIDKTVSPQSGTSGSQD